MIKVRVGDFKLGELEKTAINEVLDSGRLSEGVKVREFEKEWARFVGTKYCVAVSSGTSALICGLESLKHRYPMTKNKVITSPLTYISTANAIKLSGYEPLFVDINSHDFSVIPEEIDKLLSTRDDICGIIPVHLMGYPCSMNDINNIAKKYSVWVFEDSAEAHGSKYDGKVTGGIGELGAFSFYIAHNIQAGEMGAITTDDKEIYRLAKKIKANGRECDCDVCVRGEGKCPKISTNGDDKDPRFSHDIIGYNFKLMEFQAALGLTQLKKAEEIIRKRQENVKYLNENLDGISKHLQLPLFSNDISYLAYPIVLHGLERGKVRRSLEEEGVETRPLFGCIPTQQKAYEYLKQQYQGKLPNAEYIGKNGFYIGCHQYLEREDLEFIVNTFKKVLK